MSDGSTAPDRPPIDSPITSTSQDALSRSAVAHEFAATIRDLDTSDGIVVGVMGPWGYGKSSFINLMREQFEDQPDLVVIDFNPWMFSGSRQLVDSFFSEIAAELKVKTKNRLSSVADWLNEYKGTLTTVASFVPGAGPIAEGAQNLIAGASATTNADRSTRVLRDKLREALAQFEQPIIVVVDDIDRLTTPEIREIFKLVRLTASFPNLVYILAFDRERVERALDEDGIPGRAYLEKIVQLNYDIPQIPQKLMRVQLFEELQIILGADDEGYLDEERWSEAYFGIIDPLVRNLRDVTRFALSVRSTIRSLKGQVDLVDVLALESVRVFRPDLFAAIAQLRRELTTVTGQSFGRKDTSGKTAIERLIKRFDGSTEYVTDLLRLVFPAALRHVENVVFGTGSAQAWRKSHRVAHIDYFSLYLDRVAPDELDTFRISERAYGLFQEAGLLDVYLRSVPPETLVDVIEGLETYQGAFVEDDVVPASVTLLNLIDHLPEIKPKTMFEIRPELTVGRVVLRLLQRVNDESRREQLASVILGQLETLSSQLSFIHLIGHVDGAGHKLVRTEFADKAEQELFLRIIDDMPTFPSREWDALRVFSFAAERGADAPLAEVTDPALIEAVLTSAKSVSRSQNSLSPTIRTQDLLVWDALVSLFGSEERIRVASDVLRQSQPDHPILSLVDLYLGGWRPKSFGFDDDE